MHCRFNIYKFFFFTISSIFTFFNNSAMVWSLVKTKVFLFRSI